MAKVFEFDARKGSYIDQVSGAVGTNTNGEWARTEKGLAWDTIYSITGKVDYSSYFDFGGSDFSIVVWFKLKKGWTDNSYVTILGDQSSNSQRLVIRNNNNIYIQDNDGTIASFAFTPDYDWHHLVITRDVDGDLLTAYLDGVSLGTSAAWDGTSTFKFNRMGYSSSQYPYHGYIARVIGYTNILTSEERAKLYAEFLRSAPITKSVEENLVLPKPTDLSNVPGLVAAYSFVPV